MKKYISVKDLAEYISMKPSTIYGWVHEGYIPHYKIGGGVRFNIEEIERWIKKKKAKSILIDQYVKDTMPTGF